MRYDLKKQFKSQSAKEYFYNLLDKGAYIELREIKLKRKLDQNGLYWLWLNCLETETGTSKEQLHMLFRAKYLKKEQEGILNVLNEEFYFTLNHFVDDFIFIPGMGDIIDVISFSTTELDITQFSHYLNRIQEFARVNFNVILLNLKDQNFQEFYREYGFR